jgi:hypothetical protein
MSEEKIEEKLKKVIEFRDEIKMLWNIFRGLPRAYECPFCGYVSVKPMDKKVRMEVYYEGWPYKDCWTTKEVDFCYCPRCGATPDNCRFVFSYIDGKTKSRILHVNADDLEKIKTRQLRIETRQYKELYDRIREELKLRKKPLEDFPRCLVCESEYGFEIRDDADEILIVIGKKHYELGDFPDDVAELLWIIWRLFMKPKSMISEEQLQHL